MGLTNFRSSSNAAQACATRPVPLQTVEPQRLYRQIAEQLRALIGQGAYDAGARLPAGRDLAPRLGVSRPSGREAVIALEGGGWVGGVGGGGGGGRGRWGGGRRGGGREWSGGCGGTPGAGARAGPWRLPRPW